MRLTAWLSRTPACDQRDESAIAAAGVASARRHYEVECSGRAPAACRTIAEAAAKVVEFRTPPDSVRVVAQEVKHPLARAEIAELNRQAQAIRLIALCGDMGKGE